MADDPTLALTSHNLRSDEITTRLRDGRLDIGILRQSAVGTGFSSLPVGTVEYALFVPDAAFRQRDLQPCAPATEVRSLQFGSLWH